MAQIDFPGLPNRKPGIFRYKTTFFDIQSEVLKPSKERLSERISSLSPEIVMDYIEGLQIFMKKADKNINILRSMGGKLTESLVSELNEEEWCSLDTVVELLKDNELINRINELIDATFGFTTAKDNKEEVRNALKAIEKIDKQFTLERVLEMLVPLQLEMAKALKVLLFHLAKKKKEQDLAKYLGNIDAKDLHTLIDTCQNIYNMSEKLI